MDKLIMAIATGGYVGYAPTAPGTWGTLIAFPIHILICMLSPLGYIIALAAIFFIAVITSGGAEKIIDRKDPGVIVIDEVIGMLIALIGAPAIPVVWFIAFLLFRFFDIVKPFPVSWPDKHLNGGLGIVLDDILAGLYTLLVLQAGYMLIGI
jgi:phosphatidylglycerophosphatase A